MELVNQSIKCSLAACLFDIVYGMILLKIQCCRYTRLAVYLFVWNEGCKSVEYRVGCWVGRGPGLEGYT